MIEIECEKSPIFASALNRCFMSIYRISKLIEIAKETKNDDILRLSIPLMHSIIEDIMRNLIYYKIINSENSDFYENIPLISTENFHMTPKFTMKDLIRYKDKSIKEVVEESIEEYVNRLTFNNTNDITSWTKKFNINIDSLREYLSTIDEIFSRRHKIVHDSDYLSKRKELNSPGVVIMDGKYEKDVNPIDNEEVLKWLNIISVFSIQIIRLFLEKDQSITIRNLTTAST